MSSKNCDTFDEKNLFILKFVVNIRLFSKTNIFEMNVGAFCFRERKRS